MRKISEFRDEEALDLLAEIIDHVVDIMADEEVKTAWNDKEGSKLNVAKVIIKRHKPETMAILAAMDGVPVEDYHCNVFTLPMRIMEILNDKNFLAVFTSQVQEKPQ